MIYRLRLCKTKRFVKQTSRHKVTQASTHKKKSLHAQVKVMNLALHGHVSASNALYNALIFARQLHADSKHLKLTPHRQTYNVGASSVDICAAMRDQLCMFASSRYQRNLFQERIVARSRRSAESRFECNMRQLHVNSH